RRLPEEEGVFLDARALALAAHEYLEALEDIEVDLHVDAPVAGAALHRRLDVRLGQLLEVGPLHQRRELGEQLIEAFLFLIQRQRLERSRLRIGVEGRESVLETFEPFEVLEVEDGTDQFAELLEVLA